MLSNQIGNETAQLKMLSHEQLVKIHNYSLEVLERVGVKIYEKKALQLLQDAGAFVDMETMVAKIPAAIVEEALRTAPSRITIADQTGKRAMFLERNRVYFGGGTDLPNFTDPYTNEIRPTVLEDVENVAKVVETIDNLSYVSNTGLAADVPQSLWDMISLKAQRSYCNKPNFTTATDKGNLQAMIDMAAVMSGGYEELRRNPTLVLYNEPVSPLMNSEEAIQKLMLCAEYGIPTTYASGGVSGGTSPVTLSGSIVMSNAECLAGIAIHQLTRKGSPFIYGYIYGAMDMMTTTNVYGGPELGMVHAIMADMARFYNLPVFSTSGCTDAMEVDAQAGTEGMYSILCAALSGANIVHDNGYTGAGDIGNLSMFLLVDEHISYAKRFLDGINFDADSLAIDLIDKVSYGGAFVNQKHTAKNFKKEVYYPKYFNRKMVGAWEAEGKPTLKQKLENKVKEIIEADNPIKLEPHVIKAFDEIIAKRAKELNVEYK